MTEPELRVRLRTVHHLMAGHPVVKDAVLFYMLPHHMFSNPFGYAAFNQLRMSDIAKYHYIVESVCLDLADGVLVRNVKHRSEFTIDVH